MNKAERDAVIERLKNHHMPVDAAYCVLAITAECDRLGDEVARLLEENERLQKQVKVLLMCEPNPLL
jgi:hypothetical protein